MSDATALAELLATQPTRALGLIKRLLNASASNDLAAQLALEEALQREAGHTADFREGVTAFLEKRAPVFRGE
jgi:2-(1,2-epoxy-1,2-dihydrophenyl)acetyl-CoA isomerase